LSEEESNRFGLSVSEILKYPADFGYQAFWLMPEAPDAKASDADIHAKVGSVT
jgi:hypothetical protein